MLDMTIHSRKSGYMRQFPRGAMTSLREREIPIGAVVVCAGRVIARARLASAGAPRRPYGSCRAPCHHLHTEALGGSTQDVRST